MMRHENQGPFANGQQFGSAMTDEQARLQAEGMQQWAPSSNASQMMGVNRIGGGRFDIPADTWTRGFWAMVLVTVKGDP